MEAGGGELPTLFEGPGFVEVAMGSVDEPDWPTPCGPQLETPAVVIMLWRRVTLSSEVRRRLVWSWFESFSMWVMWCEGASGCRDSLGGNALMGASRQSCSLASPWWELTMPCNRAWSSLTAPGRLQLILNQLCTINSNTWEHMTGWRKRDRQRSGRRR